MNRKLKVFLALFAFGITYGFIYVLPYMKFTFYDQMMAAMGCTNEELGYLVSLYAIACTLSYLPGGWVADRFKTKSILIWSSFINGILCFVFMFTYTNYFLSQIIWVLCAFTGGFAFWPAMLKGIRLLSVEGEEGRTYGYFEAINGAATMLVSFIMIGVLAAFSGDLVIGFKVAIASMGVFCILASVLLYYLYDETLIATNVSDEPSINLKEFVSVFKLPGVWLVAFLMFGQVFLSVGINLLTPYSTGVLGISLVAASSIGTLRAYGARFVGGPLGGILSDKVFKSAAKGQIVFFMLCALCLSVFLLVPSGGKFTTYFLIGMMLVTGVVFYMEKGPLYAVLPELQVAPKITGTAIAFVTLIGYLPDMFVHTWFGYWLDTHGNDGYTYIFIVSIGVSLICVVLAWFCYLLTKRAKAEKAIAS